jgi:microcin C transport system substrate-binding protein
MIKRLFLVLATYLCASAAFAAPQHGFAVLGNLKYPADFRHFDYANPAAPKGGSIIFMGLGTFDSINPFILKGKKAMGSDPFRLPFTVKESFFLIPFESLMKPAADEPDSFYGLVAETVDIAEDGLGVTFKLRPEARFHDGTSITAADVVFSHNILKEKGHPSFRLYLKDVEGVSTPTPGTVHYQFRRGAEVRDLPRIVASLPILSKSYFDNHDFDKTTFDPPLGSGPYRISKVDPGRSVTYSRVKNHWAKDLPIYKGRFNFDKLQWIYFRDFDVSLEALFAGKLDFREEYTSRAWASQYNAPALEDGRLIKEELTDGSPATLQAYMINTRLEKFSDPRTRQALDLAFDFEWTNKNLFYNAYTRTESIFQNTDLAAKGMPGEADLALLEPYRAELPVEVFGPAFKAPRTDGTGNPRQNLRQARKLLSEAGWILKNGKLQNKIGKPFTIEMLSYDGRSERVNAPYIRNLSRLGIDAKFRLVDSSQYQSRLQAFDFDLTTLALSGTITPGSGLRNLLHSDAAKTTGSLNLPGIASPAVDALINKVSAAKTRQELVIAASALDRVVMAGHYLIPQWHFGKHRIAYWDKFGRPAQKPDFARGVWDLWWIDSKKAAALAAKRN